MFLFFAELVAVSLLVDLLAFRGHCHIFGVFELHVLLGRPCLPPQLVLVGVLDLDHPASFYNLFLSLLRGDLMPWSCLQAHPNHWFFLNNSHYRSDLRLLFIIRYFYYIIPVGQVPLLLRRKLSREKGKSPRAAILCKRISLGPKGESRIGIG